MGKYLVGGAVGLALGLATAAQAAAAEAPPARQGFQMAIRTGYAIPLGSAAGNVNTSGDLAMSDFVTGQVPVIFDIGGKIGPDFFLGGYFGLGFGGPAGMQSAECDALNASCTALSLHIGIEGQYHIMPGEPVNPWVGYGIGFESTAVSGTVNGQDQGIGLGGWEFAHFMGGADFRLNGTIGLGPFLDFSMGSYSVVRQDVGGLSATTDIAETALHEWLTLGVRVVFFP